MSAAPSDHGFYVVDGEHRRKALEELLKDMRVHDGEEEDQND